jgi:hypothetical protein
LIELSLRETKKKRICTFRKQASKQGRSHTHQKERKKDMMEGLTVLLKEKDKDKDKDRDKEREQPREKEKEKEKEGEMEAALYANCLLLGLDASVLGPGVGTRAGLFRHSNPRVGEALLHFLLCALRGPYLSSKVGTTTYMLPPFFLLTIVLVAVTLKSKTLTLNFSFNLFRRTLLECGQSLMLHNHVTSAK